MQKSFVASIYLEEKKAVAGLKDKTIIHMDPVALAQSYSENEVDAIIIYDFSYNDATHEAAIATIKRICESVQVPVYGAGNIKRMEDVKKLLYAGCKKAIVNLSKADSFDLLEEVSLKFGKDKIMGSVDSTSVKAYDRKLVEEYVSELVLVEDKAISESLEATTLPMNIMLPELSLDQLLALLGKASVSGVSGNVVNDNIKQIASLKNLCKENGISVHTFEPVMQFSEFKLNSDGLIPVVTQDYKTGQVLMVAYMNEEAYLNTLKTGKMTYFSRSRQSLWLKGETSGHFQYVKGLSIDCDNDTLLAKVSQVGAACHTGNYSCFYRDLIEAEAQESNPLSVFEDVFNVIKDRKVNPKEGSYTNYLFDKGIDKILKKLGEEATEIVIAAKNPEADEVKYEISDFLYHMMVLMAEKNVTWEEITHELANR